MRIVVSRTIGRPSADVWRVVADPATHTAWRPALIEFTQTSDGPLTVGTRIRERLSWRGRELLLDDVVTAVEPERLLGVKGTWEGGSFDMQLRLAPLHHGCDVTMDWGLRPHSRVLRLVLPLAGRSLRRATEEELELLERYVETDGASSVWETPHSAPPS